MGTAYQNPLNLDNWPEVRDTVTEWFEADTDAIREFMLRRNPLLGNVSPMAMCLMNRTGELMLFIEGICSPRLQDADSFS